MGEEEVCQERRRVGGGGDGGGGHKFCGMLADLAAALDSCWKRAAPDSVAHLTSSPSYDRIGDGPAAGTVVDGAPARRHRRREGDLMPPPPPPLIAPPSLNNKAGKGNGGVGGRAVSRSSTSTSSSSFRVVSPRFSFGDGVTATADFFRRGRRKERSGEGGQSPEEQKLYLQDQVLERKMTNADLRALTGSPPGLDYNEWLASHTIAFFNHVNLIYGTISEFCTISGCPDMTGPGLRQYLWFDEKGKKTKVAAPQYIDYVMTFVQKTLSDESIFPTKFDGDFPPSFESLVKKILRLLFHVIAHLYHGHFKEIVMLNLHSHLNCLFAHLILFNDRYRMIDEKETEVLADLVVALRLRDDAPGPPSQVPAPVPPSSSVLASAAAVGPEDEDEADKENCDTYCNMDATMTAVGMGASLPGAGIGVGGNGDGSRGSSNGSGSIVAAVAKMDTSEHTPSSAGNDGSVLADASGQHHA